jgi:uncharacterized protein (DUF952 family)
MMNEALIYKILPNETWTLACEEGTFQGAALDVTDGYIHFSTAGQVAETLARHFAGQLNLVLVEVPVVAISDALRWEISRGGALFPHLYAALYTDCASKVWPITLGSDGVHVLPF